MLANLKVGQQVRHSGFKGIGTVMQIQGRRVTADFPGTNGIIDDWHHFTAAGDTSPKRPRRTRMCSLIRGDYD